MRILITTGILPPDIGGPATYVPTIAKTLVERGHQVTVLTTSEPEHMNWDDSIHPSPVIRMNRRQKIWRRLTNYVAKILRYGRIVDVIYANGIYFETALANKFLRKPLVMKIVGDEAWERSVRKGWTQDSFEDFQRKRQSWQAEFFRRIRSWYVRQAQKVIVPSRYLRLIVVNWGVPEERCVVIYNAVEVSPDPTKAPELPQSFRNGQLRVITVGRLVPWKGVDKVIQAIAMIPGCTLTVVGDGPCRTEWEALAQRLGIAERVWFTGALTAPALHGLMSHHDVFVLASTYEGLPHIVVEAMLLNLPVIAAPVGGTVEVVQDNATGLLIPPEPKAIASALSRLIADPDERSRLASAGQTFALKQFSHHQMVTQTEEILKKVSNHAF
ncbi:MAG: glycosyltransferase family 4 protein [Armatimonadetes bacterium]|nr:glycosyltransferase family 4 protein [Armatimonadota bacterium]